MPSQVPSRESQIPIGESLSDPSRLSPSTKVATGVCAILLAGTVLATHLTGRLYPWLLIGATGAAGTVLAAGWFRDEVSLETLLVLFVLVSLTYRLYAFTFPPSMIGADADYQVLNMVRVADRGTVEPIAGRFYRNAPFFSLIGAETILLADIPGRWAAGIYPILAGVTLPTAVFVITRRLHPDRTAVIVATALASIAPVSTIMSISPVPQIFAMGMFVVATFALLHHYETGSNRALVLFVGLLFGLMLSHKALLFQMGTVIGAVLILTVLDRRSTGRARSSYTFVLLSITAVILYYQWFSLTGYVRSVIGQFLVAVNLEAVGLEAASSSLDGPSVTPGLELAIQSRPIRVLFNASYMLIRLPVAGFAWLYLLMTRRQSAPAQIVLGGAAATVMFLGLTIVSSVKHNPERFSVVAEPFVLVLLGVLVSALVTKYNRINWTRYRAVRIFGVVVLVCLVVSSGLTPALAPDATNKSRKYLTSDEVAGKSFGATYAAGTVRTDPYFSHEIAPPITDWRARAQINTYASMNGALANGTFPNGGYPYVAFRPQLEIYRIGGAHRLTWDPQTTLEREYNRVYDNQAVTLYRRSDRTVGWDRE